MLHKHGWTCGQPFKVRYIFGTFDGVLSVSIADFEKIGSQYGRTFLWTTLNFYTPFQIARGHWVQTRLESSAGPFDDSAIPPPNTIEAKA